MGQIPIPSSMSSWCVGLWDFGALSNDRTNLIDLHQLHATVTNDQAACGIGFHISAYKLGGGGYLLSDWKPENAVARAYFRSTIKSGTCSLLTSGTWGQTRSTITAMPDYGNMKVAALEFFLSIYPTYKKPAVAPVLSSLTDFPPLVPISN